MDEKIKKIVSGSIEAVLPDAAVKRALQKFVPGNGKTVLVAVGKAAWQMARAALSEGIDFDAGFVITKYGHIMGELEGMTMYEAGHPVPDSNTVRATREIVSYMEKLGADDTVVFLLSGGGSALFEDPLIEISELEDVTKQMLSCGADIVEMNTVRKRLSRVKGGRFAEISAPARVFTIILSDIVGDPLDMIASGPAYPDSSTCEDALYIVEKYGLRLSEKAMECIRTETPKTLENVQTVITGSVRELCRAAATICEELGYETKILTDHLGGEAREAGHELGLMAKNYIGAGKKLAFIEGGETVVHIQGIGKGGRNQELALAAAAEIDGMSGVTVLSFGSDGTDGPTDAAGGCVTGETAGLLRAKGIEIKDALSNNDSYNALKMVDSLIITGPTGTNVNDVSMLLIEG